MKTLDNLHLLVRLLEEFELPVSPILEYAIKEKEEQLMSNFTTPVFSEHGISLQNTELIEEMTVIVDSSIKKRKSSKIGLLRVYRTDGSFIQDNTVANTFAQTIKEIGAKKVHDLNIIHDGMNLVAVGGNPFYPGAQKDVGSGFFVNTHSGTLKKKRILEYIFDSLHLSWNVEIVYD